MPGASIKTEELVALNQSIDGGESPEEVLTVLSEVEYRAYRDNAPVEIIVALRKKIFNGIDLPEDFLHKTNLFNELSLKETFLNNSDEIAILCKHLDTNKVEEIKKWMLQKLANHVGTTEDNIEAQVEFANGRIGFDGPVVVVIMNDERNIVDQLQGQTKNMDIDNPELTEPFTFELDLSEGWDTKAIAEIFIKGVKKAGIYKENLLYRGFNGDDQAKTEGTVFCAPEVALGGGGIIEDQNPIEFAFDTDNPAIGIYDSGKVKGNTCPHGFIFSDPSALIAVVYIKE